VRRGPWYGRYVHDRFHVPDDDLGDRRLGDKRFLGQVPHMCDGRMQAEKSDLADKEAVPA
jgi:hypothetical protein